MTNQHTALVDRFNSQFLPEPNSGCWLWTGSCSSGRPKINVNGRPKTAYRLSYELHFGAIPDGAHICHKCNTPTCVNPDHIYAGNPATNAADALRSGRHTSIVHREQWLKNAARYSAMRPSRKHALGKSIIPHADIPLIEDRLAAGESPNRISKTYGVSRTAIVRFIERSRARVAKAKAGA